MITLDTVMAHAAKVAREAFHKRGEVRPMWAGHTADGELVFIIPESFATAADKQRAADEVRAVFKEKRVVVYAFMTEAWMVESKDTSTGGLRRALSGQSLEHHPDRREVVQITAEDKDHCLMAHYFILRPEHGKPTLSPLRKFPSEHRSGRMTHLLSE